LFKEIYRILYSMETNNYNEILDQANELYIKSKTVDCNSIDPVTWIINQEKLRKSWETFEEKSNNLGIYKPIIMDNEFSKYMKFMYDSFPAGYGDFIKKHVTENMEIKQKTPYEKNKEWRKNNPEKYKEQNRRKYLSRKERKAKLAQP
jgi:hypothetical protein